MRDENVQHDAFCFSLISTPQSPTPERLLSFFTHYKENGRRPEWGKTLQSAEVSPGSVTLKSNQLTTLDYTALNDPHSRAQPRLSAQCDPLW